MGMVVASNTVGIEDGPLISTVFPRVMAEPKLEKMTETIPAKVPSAIYSTPRGANTRIPIGMAPGKPKIVEINPPTASPFMRVNICFG